MNEPFGDELLKVRRSHYGIRRAHLQLDDGCSTWCDLKSGQGGGFKVTLGHIWILLAQPAEIGQGVAITWL